MRLHSLRLYTPFRGLPAGLDIVFRPVDTTTLPSYEQLAPLCFVGLNGSGKSNVLQVLAEIFALVEWQQFGDAAPPRPVAHDTLQFQLDYTLDRFTYQLAQSEHDLPNYDAYGAKFPIVRLLRTGTSVDAQLRFNETAVPILSTQIPLPRHVVGYSSGMNELLSNPFIQLDFRYAEQLFGIRSNQEDEEAMNLSQYLDQPIPLRSFLADQEEEGKEGGEEEEEEIDLAELPINHNRLFYLDYESNKLILLANFLIPDDKRLGLLYGMARIANVRSFSLVINYPWSIVPEALRPQLILTDVDNTSLPIDLPGRLNLILEKLINCATTWTGDRPTARTRRRLQLDFWVDAATRAAFNYHFRTADNLLNELHGLRLLSVLTYTDDLRASIRQANPNESLSLRLPRPEPASAPFYVDEVLLTKTGTSSSAPIPYRSLSDGEHQLLHVFGALLLMEQPGTLFLFDEPETHFNPDWRSRFVRLLNQITQDTERGQKREQEILLTSHSPFIVSDCQPDNVFIVSRNAAGVVMYRRPDINTFGASDSLIREEVFGKLDSISDMAKDILDRAKAHTATLADVNESRRRVLELGESFEKFDALQVLDERERQLRTDTRPNATL